jgi:hypothetical protein
VNPGLILPDIRRLPDVRRPTLDRKIEEHGLRREESS